MIKKMMISDLETAEYQRPLDERRAAKMAKVWNPTFVGMITVGNRDGKLYIIDGQHRVAAASIVGHKEIAADVVETSSAAEEAAMWKALNSGKHPTALDAYHNDLIAGIDDAVKIHQALAAVGYHVPRGQGDKGPGTAKCIAAIRSAWRRDSEAAAATIRLLARIAEGASFDNRVYDGLWYLVSGGINLTPELPRLIESSAYTRMLRAVRSAPGNLCSGTGHSQRPWASVVLDVINFKKKRRITMPGERRP